MPKLLQTLLVLVFFLLPIMAAKADILQTPKGKIVLTISGKIKHTNAPDAANFDKEMLEALGIVKVDTETYWTNGVQQFEGVPGRILMETVGVTEGTLEIQAIDKYTAKVPVDDLFNHRAILALKNMGEYMTIAKKGPIWLIYPLDDKQQLLKKQINSRSVWQIRSIEVL